MQSIKQCLKKYIYFKFYYGLPSVKLTVIINCDNREPLVNLKLNRS